VRSSAPLTLAAAAAGMRPSVAWNPSSQARGMARRSGHKLSLKRANNAASWAAAAPSLPPEHPGRRRRRRGDDGMPPPSGEALPPPPPIESGIPPLPKLQEPLDHVHIGRITGPYRISKQHAFAVIASGGTQFKVTADDVVYHPHIRGAEVNDVLELRHVLLLGGPAATVVGRPYIPGASVVAAVEEVFKDTKVHSFKKKKRKGYTRLVGHRTQLTALRVLELRTPPGTPLSLNDSPDTGAGSGGMPLAPLLMDGGVQLSNVQPIVPPAAQLAAAQQIVSPGYSGASGATLSGQELPADRP
jgi:large subunit ribosomal protein L21